MSGVSAGCLQHRLQARLALGQRQAPQILALREQQIESKEDEIVGALVGEGGLQRREIGGAMVVERHDLAVDDCVGQARRRLRDGGEFPVQSRPLRVRSAARPFSMRSCTR